MKQSELHDTTPTQLTVYQWYEIFSDARKLVNATTLSVLKILHSNANHLGYASEIAREMKLKSHATLNLVIANNAKKIAKSGIMPITFRTDSDGSLRYWDFWFEGGYENQRNSGRFFWKLKPELAEAMERLGLVGYMHLAEEIDGNSKYVEGLRKTITVNAYERNYEARNKCIKYWQAVCTVCGLDFEERYGKIGCGFMHVHHLVPLSEIQRNYIVDPISDLRPVCPNCHAMLHKRAPPLAIEELKELIRDRMKF
ncbi:MAG: HNH endonuclease [Thermoguttaceae bacterium]